jgi:hypothetical protein
MAETGDELKPAEIKRRYELATEFRLNDDLLISWRGHDRWAITDRFGNVMLRTGEWVYEPMPSSRTEEFIAATRFPLDEAFEIVGAPIPA